MKQFRWLLPVISLVLWFSSAAFAYQFGTVTQDIDLKQGPAATTPTLSRLPKGTVVTATDTPTTGFFKVRATNGAVGYVDQRALSLKPAPAAGAAQAKRQAQDQTQARRQSSRTAGPKIVLKVFYGLDMWSVPDLDPVFGQGNLSGGVTLGAEIGYMLSPSFMVGIRIEHLSKEVTGPDDHTGNTYDVKLSATPIMVGVEYGLINSSSFNLLLGGFFGPSSPSLTSTATNDTSPNETDVSGSAFTFLFKLEADLQLSSSIGIFGELGDRIMKTAEITPNNVNGSNNFYQGGTTPAPVALNFGGPVISFGLKVAF